MDKRLVIQRFLPVKVSTTSDSQLGIGSSTAEIGNLVAIMRNNVVVFETPVDLVPRTDDIPTEKNPEDPNG
jgi:hypothetical protein